MAMVCNVDIWGTTGSFASTEIHLLKVLNTTTGKSLESFTISSSLGLFSSVTSHGCDNHGCMTCSSVADSEFRIMRPAHATTGKSIASFQHQVVWGVFRVVIGKARNIKNIGRN